MAGVLKVDSINADSNLSFRIANTAVAFIDSNGLRPVSGNLSLDSTGTTGIRLPAANTLAFFEGGVEAVRIDSSGQVGIGTDSPSSPLHVVGAVRTSSGSNFAQFSNNFLRSNAAGSFFYDNATVGQSNEFRTSVSSSLDTTALTLTASGILALRGAATDATGVGITFPSSQSASSNANTLDDYEEGTWTATDASGAGLTLTNTTQRYTKVGRLVTLQIDNLSWPSNASGSSTEVGGLPFVAGSISAASGGISSFTTNTVQFFIPSNESKFRLYNSPSAYTRTTNANMSEKSFYTTITYSV